MDLIVDGLESRKTGEKYHDFVLDDAISSIKRAKEALEEGLVDPEKWWSDSLIQAKTMATLFPFMYLLQQQLSRNSPQVAEGNSPTTPRGDSEAGDTYASELT